MDYLPPRPLDAHSAFILGQQIARLHQWSDQPQFGLDFDNALSTTPQPNTGNVAGQLFAEQRIGWQLELAAEKGSLSAISMPSSSIFSSVLPRINRSLLCCTAIYGPATVRWVRMARTFSTRPVTGVTESATRRCYRCILNSRHKSMTAISQYPLPADFLERQPVYQLYTLLNRARLFGGQHLVIAQQSLDRLLAA